MIGLPDFRLEVFLGCFEAVARHNLTASDAPPMTIGELLQLATPKERAAFLNLSLSYRPSTGSRELRDAIAGTYNNRSAEDICCFTGAEEAIFWTLNELLDERDHAIVTIPNYQSLEDVPISTGADVSGLSLGDKPPWNLDLDKLESLLRPNTKVVVVNFPNNPTGFIPHTETFHELVDMCDAKGIRLFSDEVFRGLELDPDGRLPQAADLSECAISLNTMSKSYGLPGLRTGWIATADREIISRLERRKHYTSMCNAAPSEELATIALTWAEKIQAKNREIIRENLVLFDAFFHKWEELFEWYRPDGGCVVFPRYRHEGIETLCHQLARQKSVILLPPSAFASNLGEVANDRFRVGMGQRNPEAALQALDEFLNSWR